LKENRELQRKTESLEKERRAAQRKHDAEEVEKRCGKNNVNRRLQYRAQLAEKDPEQRLPALNPYQRIYDTRRRRYSEVN